MTNADTAHEKNFFEDGYVMLRNVIESSLLEEVANILTRETSTMLSKPAHYQDNFRDLLEQYDQHDIQKRLFIALHNEDIPQRLLSSTSLLNTLIRFLGPDLAYEEYPELAVNVKHVEDDYFLKKWHQEFWSGNGSHTIQLWFPIAIEENMGGLELVRGSHLWGHIPHRNREPVELPPEIDVVCPTVAVGDAIIFHTFTLHRTVPNMSSQPRFALPIGIKNFYHNDTGVPFFTTWRPFHYSPLAKIQKRLGNSSFSPFRTLGSTRKDTSIDPRHRQ